MQKRDRLRVVGALALGALAAGAVSAHATQWLARSWGYHPNLGASLAVPAALRAALVAAAAAAAWWAWRGWTRRRSVAGTVAALGALAASLGLYRRLFAPWGVYRWARWSEGTGEWSRVAPAFYAATLTSACCVLGALVFAAWRNQQEAKAALLATARYATPGDLRAAGVLVARRTPSGDESAGVLLGLPQRGDGALRTPGAKPTNVLVVGPPRTGKGIGIVLPNVLDPCPVSRVVIDPKGEAFAQSSQWLQEQGFHVLRFDPTRPAGASASAWNPIAELRADPTFGVGDAMRLARMLSDPEGEGGRESQFFQRTAALLLQGLILEALLGDTLAPTLPALAAVGEEDSEALYMRLKTEGAHTKVQNVAAQMLKMPKQTRGNIEATVFSYLGIFADPLMAQHISRSDFALLDLLTADQPVALFVTVPEVASPLALPMVRVFMQMLLWALSDRLREAQAKWRLRIIADEFASFGQMPEWRSALGRLPGVGQGVDTILVVQTATDLAYHYRDIEVIADLCDYKVVLRCQGKSAEWVSKALGEREVTRERRSWRAGTLKEHGQVSVSQDKRALVTADEIARLGLDEVLVQAAGQYPYRGRLIHHYRDAPWADRVRGEADAVSCLTGAAA